MKFKCILKFCKNTVLKEKHKEKSSDSIEMSYFKISKIRHLSFLAWNDLYVVFYFSLPHQKLIKSQFLK